MQITNFAERPSLLSRYMMEMRDSNLQRDPMRFRRNLERAG